MYTFLFLSPLLAAGCLLNPQQKPAAQIPATSGTDMFPPPSAGISIAAGPGEDMKLEKLLDEFSKVTGVALLASPETKMILQKSTTGLNRGIEIPAGEVYAVVETVLIRNELALVPVHDRDPRIASVVALTQNGAQALRSSAIFVPARDIAAFARHPAVLVTTFLDLPHVDVRTISNSMRTMFTDANTQQIIPVGNSNALIVTGFGGTVAGIVRLLQEVDENAKREMAEQGESKVQTSVPSKEEKPK